jgi:hypothetical protein
MPGRMSVRVNEQRRLKIPVPIIVSIILIVVYDTIGLATLIFNKYINRFILGKLTNAIAYALSS